MTSIAYQDSRPHQSNARASTVVSRQTNVDLATLHTATTIHMMGQEPYIPKMLRTMTGNVTAYVAPILPVAVITKLGQGLAVYTIADGAVVSSFHCPLTKSQLWERTLNSESISSKFWQSRKEKSPELFQYRSIGSRVLSQSHHHETPTATRVKGL